jgi:hypothetical protein
MERWRWLPRDFGAAYVLVNVPDYTLKVVNLGKTVWSTRAFEPEQPIRTCQAIADTEAAASEPGLSPI